MREILFRGKRVDNGEWVYGNYAFTDFDNKQYFIFQNKAFEHLVIPETVGQYTGLTDKNGKKIFEGDIVEYQNGYGHIEWAQLHGAFMCVEENGDYWEWLDNMYDIEVIGNIHDIHDNPELLKGGEG